MTPTLVTVLSTTAEDFSFCARLLVDPRDKWTCVDYWSSLSEIVLTNCITHARTHIQPENIMPSAA